MILDYLKEQGFKTRSLANMHSGDLTFFSPNMNDWYVRHLNFEFAIRIHSFNQLKRVVNRYKRWQKKGEK